MLIDTLAALWAINRRAKRCRDLASTHYKTGTHGFAAVSKAEKLELYRLKGQALHYLLLEKRLEVVGHHRFPEGNWAEVLKGSGYTFHRPCPTQQGQAVNEIDEIEAKPRGSKEPRLKDALYSIKAYLDGKPQVCVFESAHKAPFRPRRLSRHWNDFDEDSDEDVEDDDFDDELAGSGHGIW